jgi:hypothetical protein
MSMHIGGDVLSPILRILIVTWFSSVMCSGDAHLIMNLMAFLQKAILPKAPNYFHIILPGLFLPKYFVLNH